ncbi:MAG: thiamine pyrophosphate-dependent enzyme [Candidatus Delongbacteria bacterium]
MENKYLSTEVSIFCKGCGHQLIAVNTEKALNKLGLSPKDVILVTDIGCHGILDKLSSTHTFHGLHGRSAALAAGTSMGLENPKKKVIVFIGDGGSTIGLQHLVDAAVKNVNMTVIVHNNMLYGMTGGQTSGLTPEGFKTETNPAGKQYQNYDISSMLSNAGGSHVRRLVGMGDFSEELYQAFKVQGFSSVEVMEICTSYGVKFNTGKKVTDFIESAGMEIKLFPEKIRAPYKQNERDIMSSLFENIEAINVKYKNKLKKPLKIIVSGSAGEGAQLAAELFAEAAVGSGLKITKKGSYPVTVGVGFSTAELIISPKDILYTGIVTPDIFVITSNDGLNHAKAKLSKMKKGLLLIDATLNPVAVDPGVEVIQYKFRELATPRSAMFLAMDILLKYVPSFPAEAFEEAIANSKIGAKFNMEVLKKAEVPKK